MYVLLQGLQTPRLCQSNQEAKMLLCSPQPRLGSRTSPQAWNTSLSWRKISAGWLRLSRTRYMFICYSSSGLILSNWISERTSLCFSIVKVCFRWVVFISAFIVYSTYLFVVLSIVLAIIYYIVNHLVVCWLVWHLEQCLHRLLYELPWFKIWLNWANNSLQPTITHSF